MSPATTVAWFGLWTAGGIYLEATTEAGSRASGLRASARRRAPLPREVPVSCAARLEQPTHHQPAPLAPMNLRRRGSDKVPMRRRRHSEGSIGVANELVIMRSDGSALYEVAT